MSGDAAMFLRQVRYENRSFWRNPIAAFFTFAFPLIFMVIFNVIFSSQAGLSGEQAANFFTPSIIAFSIVNACFTTLAMGVTTTRDEGILKRIHGTPLPTLTYLAARITLSVIIGLLLVLIVSLFGALVYHVTPPTEQIPALVLTLLVGAATFCALGLAISGFIPNANAAPAVVNAIVLPLLFISDVFIRLPPDSFLASIASFFPIRPFALSLQALYSPSIFGSFKPLDIVWVAVWGVAGVLIALRTFTWEPRG